MIDAFVAMGGNEDKSGEIDSSKLIDVIRNQFELPGEVHHCR